MVKYFIYCRKSSEEEERQILSIEAQVQELRDFAKQNNLYIEHEYTESKTAKEPGRIVFNKMLEQMELGKAQGILAWNPDRLARNSIDGGRVIYLVDTGKIVSLKFPTFWFEATPQGKFMLNVAFGQAKYFTDNLRENILRDIRQKLRRGEMPGKAPLGYINDPRLRSIEPDPDKYHLVKQMLELFATGQYTLSTIADKMFSLGLAGKSKKPLHISSVQKTLSKSFYYGHFYYSGELWQGKHKPMISKQLFDQIQLALKQNESQRDSTLAQNWKEQIQTSELKLNKLADAYLDSTFTKDEYQTKKSELLTTKKDIEEKLSNFERQGSRWLELMKHWILEASQPENLVKTKNFPDMKSFLQTVGSNRQLGNGKLSMNFIKPWDLLSKIPATAKGGINFARAVGSSEADQSQSNRIWCRIIRIVRTHFAAEGGVKAPEISSREF